MENLENKTVIEIKNEGMATVDFDSLNIGLLTDYIINTHHQYVKNAILQILPLTQKAIDVNGSKSSELAIIQSLFRQISNEMLLHMKKEELVLFPYIKKLTQAESDQTKVERPGFGSIKIPTKVMETEHETASIMMQRLSKLSNDYASPEDDSETFSLLFGKLKEFDADLQMHVHLENDILHPKAIALEQALLAS